MLYEVITSITYKMDLLEVFKNYRFTSDLYEVYNLVITSYSIHYTKLYDSYLKYKEYIKFILKVLRV